MTHRPHVHLLCTATSQHRHECRSQESLTLGTGPHRSPHRDALTSYTKASVSAPALPPTSGSFTRTGFHPVEGKGAKFITLLRQNWPLSGLGRRETPAGCHIPLWAVYSRTRPLFSTLCSHTDLRTRFADWWPQALPGVGTQQAKEGASTVGEWESQACQSLELPENK